MSETENMPGLKIEVIPKDKDSDGMRLTTDLSTNERMANAGIRKERIKFSSYTFHNIKTGEELFKGNLQDINKYLTDKGF